MSMTRRDFMKFLGLGAVAAVAETLLPAKEAKAWDNGAPVGGDLQTWSQQRDYAQYYIMPSLRRMGVRYAVLQPASDNNGQDLFVLETDIPVFRRNRLIKNYLRICINNAEGVTAYGDELDRNNFFDRATGTNEVLLFVERYRNAAGGGRRFEGRGYDDRDYRRGPDRHDHRDDRRGLPPRNDRPGW